MTECVLRAEEESAGMEGGARGKDFHDSFALRISRAGDRASNPFPDAFLIAQESPRGWDRMGLGRWAVGVTLGRVDSPPWCHTCQ